MNKLSIERQTQVIKVLCEGNSIRSTARITGTAINSVIKLLCEVGAACEKYQDKNLRHLSCKRIECDEIWSFCYAKERNVPEEHKGKLGYGDVWTFVAIDADSKLCLTWLVGWRDPENAFDFALDIRRRLSTRVQLTTDGHRMYLNAMGYVFGSDAYYAILVKLYGKLESGIEGKYSPPKCISAKAQRISGHPDLSKASTSYVERQNLTMRMQMRRYTRLTNGFSKKIENHKYALALYFMHYNFVKTHSTLANPYPRTPAMAAGITDHIWSAEEIVHLINSDKS